MTVLIIMVSPDKSDTSDYSKAMRLSPSSLISLLLFLAVLGVWGETLCDENSPSSQNYKIVVGTSAIYSAVREFVDGTSISGIVIPPDLCPGHFDLKPSDFEKFSHSDLIILHEWQKNLPAIKSLIQGANPPPENLLWIALEGSWMVPDNYLRGLKAIGESLVKKKIIDTKTFEKTLEKRTTEISKFSQEVKSKIKSVEPQNINVVSSTFQKEFLIWLGFNVVAEYPRAEELTIRIWGELLNIGKNKNVKLVVENLQSGEIQTVKTLAKELGAKSVILSNFPLISTHDESWEDSVLHNVDNIINSLK